MNPFDQTKPPPPSPAEGADDVIELTEKVDDVIELTEVVEEAPTEAAPEALTEMVDEATAEVVLDFRPGNDELAALKSSVEPREEKPAAPREESLDDFLASLPDLPEDLDISPEASPPPGPKAPDLRQELAQRLSDAELQEVVRQVVQETVERLARELFPQMASEAIERELNLWKKRLTEPD